MDEGHILKTANTILSQLTVPKRVKTLKDVNADLFITIYEGLCGETIPDLVSPATTEEAQIHNMQCVIDSLAMDVLHTSLAHITGQDIVQGRTMSIINLLDIFSGLLEYILDGIAKEDNNDEESQNMDAAKVLNKSQMPKDITNSGSATSDDNTEDLIALGDEKYLNVKSPTSSPSNKKSKQSAGKESRRRSKRITPNVVTHPMASSSMQSIHPSATDTESDASVKPTASRALAFSKVPAEFSPPQRPFSIAKNETFTKPAIPAEKRPSETLADKILKTGESTEELIALANTPLSTRPRTRSATKALQKTLETSSQEESSDNERNISNNAKRHGQETAGSKRTRVTKRHVSFVSDRSVATRDDTLTDVRTQSEDPRRVVSDKDLKAATSLSADRANISARLEEYFNQKERAAGDNHLPQNSDSDQPSSSEFRTAMEKSASLYDRVTALRNAATEKLESLRQSNTSSLSTDYETARTHPAPLVGNREPLSDYARRKQQETSDQSVFETAGQSEGATDTYKTAASYRAGLTGDYQTASLGMRQQPAYRRVDEDEDSYKTAAATAVQSNLSGDYLTAKHSSITDLPYHTASEYGTKTSDYRSARTDPSSDALYKTARADSEPLYRTATERLESEEFTTATEELSPVPRAADGQLRFIVDDNDGYGRYDDLQGEPPSYSRPDWRSVAPPDEKSKKVRFTRSKASTSSASKKKPSQKSETMFEAVRKTLQEEKWKERLQHKLLSKQYRDDLSDMVEAHREQLEEEKEQARKQDREFSANIQRLVEAYNEQPKKTALAYKPKGYLLPKTRYMKTKPLTSRSESSSGQTAGPSKPLDPNDDDFLPNLMDEFPHLYLAPETIKKMWEDHQRQSAAIQHCLEEDKRKQSKAKVTIEDAEKRQAILMKIMQKEMEHTKRIKQMRDKENAETEHKRKARDQRQQSARVKKYYDDYAVRMKSSMLRNRTKEEQLFKQLFAEGLKVQKERMHALRSYAKEQRQKRAKQQQIDVQALENFYKDQFTMLADSVAQERRNVEIRDTAQAEVLTKMKQELRKKMENDIRTFQDQLKRDEEDYYFRQLDAEKVVQQLNMTRFQTGL